MVKDVSHLELKGAGTKPKSFLDKGPEGSLLNYRGTVRVGNVFWF